MPANRDRRIPKFFEAEHHSNALLYTAMVPLDQVVQVFRRAQLRVRGQPAIGFQLTHRTVPRGTISSATASTSRRGSKASPNRAASASLKMPIDRCAG